MIELPYFARTNSVTPALMDFGMIMRPSTGGKVQRLDRKGNRFRARVSLAPLMEMQAEEVVADLIRAKRQGIRLPVTLLYNPGTPGAPVVDGAAPSGTSLPVRGLTALYWVRKGYWLSIEDAAGQHYLHKVVAAARANGTGHATIDIEPELRIDFADGATVHLAKPMVEGFVDGDAWEWTVPVGKRVRLEFPVEEAA